MVTTSKRRAPAGVDGDFATTLWRRGRRWDGLLLAILPVLLIYVYTLPAATRRSLTFTYTDPTAVTAFTTHFVHFTLDHLLANLFAYMVLVGVGYALAVLAGRRLFFLTATAVVVFVFPVLLSGLNLSLPRYAIGYGASGLNMGLFGLVALLLVSYARRCLDLAIPIRLAPAVFFALLAWMVILGLPFSPVAIGLATLALLGFGIYAVSLRDRGLPSVGTVTARIVETGRFGDLFAIGIALLVVYPVIGFPTEPASTGSVVNLYVHLLGFALAFIGPYVLLERGVFEDSN